jgi:hypothetical protein
MSKNLDLLQINIPQKIFFAFSNTLIKFGIAGS